MAPVNVTFQSPQWPRRILPALLGLFLFWGFVLSMGAGAAADTRVPEALGSISGTVTIASGQPISGVEVVVYRNDELGHWILIRRVTTTDAGFYVVPALRTGIYRLHLRAPQGDHAQEYYDKSTTLDGGTDIPVAGNDVTGVDVQLAPAASISGAVTILNDVAPDRGLVSLYGQVGDEWQFVHLTTLVTPTGAYHLGEVLSGTYRICGFGVLGNEYNADTFFGCYGGAKPESARSIQVTTGATLAHLDFQLTAGQYDGQIAGRVTANGAPLSGIQVALYSPYVPNFPNPYLPLVYTYTNAVGAYRFGGLQDGAYQIGFSDPAGNYVSRYYRDKIWPDTADLVHVRNGATIGAINANLPRAGAISGRIHFVAGQPAAPLQMSLILVTEGGVSFHGRQIETDPAGDYQIRALEPGAYRACLPFELTYGDPDPDSPSYFPNCYGTDRFSRIEYEYAADIVVTAGATTSGIDFTVGPDRWYMPVIHR